MGFQTKNPPRTMERFEEGLRVCEQMLPASIRFSGVEAAKVDRLLQVERERHRAWLSKSEER